MSQKRNDPEAIAEYQRLVTLVERLSRQESEVEGRLKVFREQLQTEFGCQTVQEGEELLAKERQKLVQQERKLTQLIEAFEQKYGHYLD